MSKTATVRAARRAQPTVRVLQQRLDKLQQRVEDLEDLRELEQAIAKNAGKPLVPWDKAKKDLGLD
jgi:hypothetical protein